MTCTDLSCREVQTPKIHHWADITSLCYTHKGFRAPWGCLRQSLGRLVVWLRYTRVWGWGGGGGGGRVGGGGGGHYRWLPPHEATTSRLPYSD